MESEDFSIIIPAAGMGKRMKSFGPKSLINIGSSTSNVLSRQITILQQNYPKSDIVIVTGFEDEKVNKFLNDWKGKVVSSRIKVVKNNNFQNNNVAKSVCLATEYCDANNYLIVYGDLVFNEATIRKFNPQKSSVLVSENDDFDKEEIGVSLDERREINHFFYDSKIKWSQIAYLKNIEMEGFLNIMDKPHREKWFCFEVFNKMLEQGYTLKPFFNHEARVVELDNSKDVHRARELFLKGQL
jgi:choline kinase